MAGDWVACMKKTAGWAIIIMASTLALACDGSSEPVAELLDSVAEPELAERGEGEEVSVDQIVFMTTDGELFLVNPDGSGQLKLAGDTQLQVGPLGAVMAQPSEGNVFYSWPTWSPDGKKLAASLIEATGGQPEISVQVIDASTGATTTVFRNEVPSLIAESAPHYLYWSPDSRTLAVLASTSSGLTLYAADTQSLTEPTIIESGAPLYFHWGADGQSILMHVGDELKFLTRPFGASSGQPIDAAPGFRVPALSPDGRSMAYMGTGTPSGSLLITETGETGTARNALDIGFRAAFAWSPLGDDLAVADQQTHSAPTFERLRVVRGDGGPVMTVAEGRIIAFYWSPNGEMLAWAGLDADNGEFVWWAATVEKGEARELLRAQPTNDMLMTLSFFDQYAYSHSPWSPDGSSLVLAAVPNRSTEGRNGSMPPGPRVFVVQADGTSEPLEVGAGSLAFWSWN